jgi:predicted RNase H-like nuclease
MYLGLDGFRHGWVAASIDGKGNGSVEFLCEVNQLDHRQYRLAMIDIPIGLPSFGNRECDIAARALLAENWPRVFTGARRPLLEYCHSYEEANQFAPTLQVDEKPGAKISKQLFCLLKKIKEVDAAIDAERQKTVRECHPELVFRRLNNNGSVPNKHTDEGRLKRRELLCAHVSNLNALIDERLGTGAKEDDVLDAFGCAVAAMDCAKGRQLVLPENECRRDARKLKMQIWY